MATAAVRTLSLRAGAARDIDVVERLMDAAFDSRWGEGWTRGQCLGVLAMPGVRLTLAYADDRPAGFAMVRQVVDEVELLLVAVAPVQRRRGVGEALLGAVIDDARSASAHRIHLEVRAGNDAARLYRRAGFAKIGERRGYYRGRGGQLHDAHTFALELGALSSPRP